MISKLLVILGSIFVMALVLLVFGWVCFRIFTGG